MCLSGCPQLELLGGSTQASPSGKPAGKATGLRHCLSRCASSCWRCGNELSPRAQPRQAARHTLSLWTRLTVFLKHPELELSNHFAENSMRTVPSEEIGYTWAAKRPVRGVPPSSPWSRVAAASACPSASTWPMFCPVSPAAPSRPRPASRLPLTPPIRQNNLPAHHAPRQPCGCSDA